MENMSRYRIEQAERERAFIAVSLYEATMRLLIRRGETLEDLIPGWMVKTMVSDEGHDSYEEIFFESKFDINDDGREGFSYRIYKSTEMTHDYEACSSSEKAEIRDILATPNEWIERGQAQSLLEVLAQIDSDEHEADGADDEDASNTMLADEDDDGVLRIRRELRFTCLAEDRNDQILMERAMALYIDDVMISCTAVGDVHVNAPAPDYDGDDSEAAPGEVLIDALGPGAAVDFSKLTHSDLEELHAMLQMLGLAYRSQAA